MMTRGCDGTRNACRLGEETGDMQKEEIKKEMLGRMNSRILGLGKR